jgi:hypothetical protein
MATEIEREVSEQDPYYGTVSAFDEDDVSGWSLFAGMMIIGIGLFALTATCIGFLNNSFIQEYSMIGDRLDSIWYGLYDGLTAIVAFVAGFAIWQGRKIGFWLGLIIATLSAARWFMFIQAIPLWSLAMLVIWLLVVYGLIHDRKQFT